MIIKALKSLGIKGQALVKYIDTDRALIFVDGVYLGIYDLIRNTFVD